MGSPVNLDFEFQRERSAFALFPEENAEGRVIGKEPQQVVFMVSGAVALDNLSDRLAARILVDERQAGVFRAVEFSLDDKGAGFLVHRPSRVIFPLWRSSLFGVSSNMFSWPSPISIGRVCTSSPVSSRTISTVR